MWSDNETDIDLLGFQAHSDLILDLVTDVDLLPVTVGVFGDWGSGKSSIMRMLERDLAEWDGVASIYFNGWQFEGYDEAKSALVHSILLQLGEHQKLGPKVKKRVVSLLKRVDWLRLANVGYQTLVAPLIAQQFAVMAGLPPVVVPPSPGAPLPTSEPLLDDEDLAKIDLNSVLKENPTNKGILGVREFRRDFEELIAETNLDALVILIDDLDRCSPERLIETLEAIKLFLAVRHVAFVIGADEWIVRYAIAKRYQTERVERDEPAGNERVDLVTDYLEKLIQIPYHLPRLSPSEIETYINLLLCQRYLPDDFDSIHIACLNARTDQIAITFGHQHVAAALQGKEIPDELAHELAWCHSIAPALSDVLKGNPRQTKRLLNALILRRKLADKAGLRVSSQVLVKLMLLEYLHPSLFAQLYQWQAAQQGFPKQLQALEHGTDGRDENLSSLAKSIITEESTWSNPNMRAWLQMPPLLSSEDLRDYFWIARDRVTGLLAGVTLLSPHLRQLLATLLEAEPGAMKESKRQVGQLSPEEQNILLQELAKHLQREPAESHLIKVWLDLADVMPAAPVRLLAALESMPADAVAKTTPARLVLLAKRHAEVRDRVESLLNTWLHSSLRRAAEDALKDLRGGRS